MTDFHPKRSGAHGHIPALLGAAVLGISAIGLSACGGGDEPDDAPAAATQDGRSPLDTPFRMRGADPAELDRFNALIGARDDQSFQIGRTSFDDNLGAVVLTNVSNTQGGRVFTIGRAELYGVNYDYLEALRANAAGGPPAGEGMTDVFRKVRLFDVTLSGFEDMAFNGEITLDAVEFDDMALNATPMAERDPGAPGLSLAGLYFRDAMLDATAEDDRELDITVADGRLTGVSRGAFEALLVDGLSYTVIQDRDAVIARIAEAQPDRAAMFDGILGQIFIPENQRFEVSRIEWGGADFSGLLAHLDSGGVPPASASDLISVGGLTMRDMVTTIDGRQASTTELTEVDPIAFEWLIPASIEARSTGTTADLTAYVPEDDTAMRAAMREHGLADIESEGTVSWRFDRAATTGRFDYDVAMDELGGFSFAYGLSGLDVEPLANAAATRNPLGLASIALDDLSLTIEDEGLVDAITAVAAVETGQDPQALAQALPGYIELGSAQAAAAMPQVEAYAETVNAFLAEGGALNIALAPDEPVQFLTLFVTLQAAPQALPETLGLTVEHED